MARRFHDARFDARFDATAPVSLWPPYLRQEHAQDRFTRAMSERREVVRVLRLQRLRVRPLTALPKTNVTSAPAVMKVPWRIWTIRR